MRTTPLAVVPNANSLAKGVELADSSFSITLVNEAFPCGFTHMMSRMVSV